MNIGILILQFNASFHIFFINQQWPQIGINTISRDLVKISNSPMIRIDPLRKQLLKCNLGAIGYTRVQNLGRITKMGSCPGNGVCVIQDGRWQERCSLSKNNTNVFKISCTLCHKSLCSPIS